MKFKKPVNFYSNKFRRSGRYYAPFYNDKADYNTNAKSYYDWLADHLIPFMRWAENLINRLLRRNITVEDTSTIDFSKQGDWNENGKCPPYDYDDIINLKADVIFSKETEERNLLNITPFNFTIPNGSKDKKGVWSPDYFGLFEAVDTEIGKIQNDISWIKQKITSIENEISSIWNNISNMYSYFKNEITNIYKEIDSLAGSNFVRLEKGKDYDITFLNGWVAGQDDVIVEVSTGARNTTVNIQASASSPETNLSNPNILNTRFNHGAGVDEENYLKSRILRITFKGKYDVLNTGNTVAQANQAIINIRPLVRRASWTAYFQARKLNGGVEVSMGSYADGYNNQLSYYCEDGDFAQGSNLKMQYLTTKVVK